MKFEYKTGDRRFFVDAAKSEPSDLSKDSMEEYMKVTNHKTAPAPSWKVTPPSNTNMQKDALPSLLQPQVSLLERQQDTPTWSTAVNEDNTSLFVRNDRRKSDRRATTGKVLLCTRSGGDRRKKTIDVAV